MIQDVVAIRDGDTRCLQLRDRANDAARCQIAFWVVVLSDNQDAGVIALCHDDQVVQILKIAIVFREKDTGVANRVRQVDGIRLS